MCKLRMGHSVCVEVKGQCSRVGVLLPQVDSRLLTQVLGLVGRHLHPLSHPAGLGVIFSVCPVPPSYVLEPCPLNTTCHLSSAEG